MSFLGPLQGKLCSKASQTNVSFVIILERFIMATSGLGYRSKHATLTVRLTGKIGHSEAYRTSRPLLTVEYVKGVCGSLARV